MQFSELQVTDLDLDLRSGEGHISMRNTYRTTSVPEHVTIASSSMEIWLFEIRIILTFREVRTCDSFLKRKLENRALTGCRLDPVLS